MVQFDERRLKEKVSDLRIQEAERYVQAKAPQLGYEYVNLRGYTINPEALVAIPEAAAKEACVVGFELHKGVLSVAATKPNAPETQELLTKLQQQHDGLAVYLCSETSLKHAWKRYNDIRGATAERKGVFEISPEDIERIAQKISQPQDVVAEIAAVNQLDNNRRTSEVLEIIFAGALALDASDIHIEPEPEAVRLRYRFDGVLHDVTDLDSLLLNRILARLKLLSGMVLNQKSVAQDGRFTFVTGEREIEVRSSVIPGASGESIVMRLLDPSAASFSIEHIELNPHIEGVIRQQIKKPNGLIITTGPTGSGKTTALYAYLQEVHAEGVKIITLENPVEYKLDGIVQTQVEDEYTFATGLRAILRQDPDIIMVGEIRDREVAETAIHAAQTGHLVFTTLHTNSAVAGFARLIDLGVDPRIMGSSINIVMGQRLVRKLCPTCKEAYTPSEVEHELISRIMHEHPHPTSLPEPLTLYRATGCQACNDTGFIGRMGIFEGIVMDEAVEEAVINDPREHVILAAAKPQGIPSMVEDGIEKVIAGITSLTELERVIELPHHIVSAIDRPHQPVSDDLDETFAAHVVD